MQIKLLKKTTTQQIRLTYWYYAIITFIYNPTNGGITTSLDKTISSRYHWIQRLYIERSQIEYHNTTLNTFWVQKYIV